MQWTPGSNDDDANLIKAEGTSSLADGEQVVSPRRCISLQPALRSVREWRLRQDLGRLEDVLDRRIQKGIWDDSIARGLAKKLSVNPANASIYGMLFEEFEASDSVESEMSRTSTCGCFLVVRIPRAT